MKSAYLLTAALLVGVLSSAAAEEQTKKKKPNHNPSGTWVWESDVDGGYIESTLKLTLRGKKLSGEYSDQNVTLDIENPSFDGETVKFTLEFDVDGTEVSAEFSGVASGDKLTGVSKVDINGAEFELPVDADRRTGRRDVTGQWKFKVETPEGEVFEPVVNLKLARGKLVGSYEGDAAGSHELQEVKLKDNKLSFKIGGEAADGSSFTAMFTGKPRGDRIRGKAEVEINGAAMTAKVRGQRVVEKEDKGE